MMFLFQAVGFLALLLDVSSLQFKHRKNILILQILASVAWVIHFILIGAIAGAAMNGVGVLRSIGYYKFRSDPRPWWLPWALVALAIGVTIVTWKSVYSLMPLFAMILAIYGLWQKGEQKIRIVLLLCVPLWLVYNVIFHSYAGIASDLLALLSGSIALYRYRKQGMNAAE